MRTAFESLQPTLMAPGAPQLEGVAPTLPSPDTLKINGKDTVPASVQTLAGKAIQTAFESLASTAPAEGRGTVIFTTNTKLEDDPQSGS